MSEQGVPVMTANQIKQMLDADILVFHHNLPAFRARRMNWLEHPILKRRTAAPPPKLDPLPPLTPLEFRDVEDSAEVAFVDPDERYQNN